MPLSRINTASIANNSIIAADILANTITGDKLVANTLANSVFQTGSVENYLNASGNSVTGKNKIINGAMLVDQRYSGSANTPAEAQYVLDRWQGRLSQSGKYTIQKDSSANTVAGFSSSLKVTSTSSYSLGASDYFTVNQRVEGLNWADLRWGTASASPITLSFWVRSSVTGTFGGGFTNSAFNRSYVYTYSIVAADTWEKKTITIPGDTSGTWVSDTGIGTEFWFNIGTGTSYSNTPGSWLAGGYFAPTGASSIVGTSGATWYVTGVQIERGNIATPFEYRQYTTELQLCQRYYETSYNQGNTEQVVPTNVPNSYAFLKTGTNTIAGGSGTAQETMGPFFFKVSKRANPTVTIYSYTTSTTSMASNGWTGSDLAASTGSIGDTYKYGFTVINKSGGNVTTGGYGIIFGFAASAEL
jgi:hypothetical protein